jgi:hypothetical protein
MLKPEQIIWIFAEEFCNKKPVFKKQTQTKPNEIIEGQLDDTWLISALKFLVITLSII